MLKVLEGMGQASLLPNSLTYLPKRILVRGIQNVYYFNGVQYLKTVSTPLFNTLAY